MKKYKNIMIKIIKPLLFALIVWAIYVPLTYVYRGTLANTRANLAGWYEEEKDSLDVVILGTSPTFSAIMPMEMWGDYGITAYDMCVNVLFEDSMKYYVREIRKTQNPQVLIVDTASFLYGLKSSTFVEEEGKLRYNTDGLMISRNRFDLINEIIPKGKRLEYYFDLFFYHGNTDVNYDYVFNKYPNINKGYSHLPQQVSFQEADYLTSDEVIPLPDVDNTYFISLLEELKDFDGEVLFMELPLFYTQDLAVTCGYSEYMEDMVLEYGYDYLDLSKVRDDIGLDSQFDYSLDYLHFNALSAEKITDYLSQYISKNYELADHRADAVYENWQTQYETWLEVKAYLQGLNESEILERFQAADLDQYISFMESEYYSGTVDYSEDSAHVTLIKNRTNEVVDDGYFVYNETDDRWVRNGTE